MKKVKLSSLPLVSPKYNDNIMAQQSSGQTAFIKSQDISSIRNYMALLGAGEEYAIPESEEANIRVLFISHSNAGSSGLVLLGATSNQISVIGSTGLSIGTSPEGSGSFLVYRKESNGVIFVKNNTGVSATIRMRTF